jgi:hypothetical protein
MLNNASGVRKSSLRRGWKRSRKLLKRMSRTRSDSALPSCRQRPPTYRTSSSIATRSGKARWTAARCCSWPLRENLPPGSGATAQYLKHREMVRHQLGADLVLLLLGRVPGAIRRQMMERKIGFIAPGAQLYVPEVFLDLRERAPAFALSSRRADQPDHAIPATGGHAGPHPGRPEPHRTMRTGCESRS